MSPAAAQASAAKVTQRAIETPLGLAKVTVHRPASPRGTLVLTHGANGAMTTPDLVALPGAVTAAGWALALVQQAWAVAGRRTPPRPPQQDEAWLPVVAALRSGRAALPGPLVLSGRSNGARVACRTAIELGADGVIALAFPLHPPGKPEVSRADELLAPIAAGLRTVVIQGRTDAFGSGEEIRAVLPDPSIVVDVKGGHGFAKPPTEVLAAVTDFLAGE